MKKNYISFLIGIMFLIMPVTSMMMIDHITISQTIVNYENGYLGNYSGCVQIETKDVDKVYETIMKVDKSIAIYQEYLDGQNIKSIYFEKEYKNIPMRKGRFFLKEDFQEDNYYAVVGKNYEEEIYDKKGSSYIDIMGVPFKVIGIMGMKDITSMDRDIWINSRVSEAKGIQNIYRLDFLEGNGRELYEKCLDYLEVSFPGKVEEISQEEGVLYSMLPEVLYGRWYIGILLCDVLCIILLSYEWKNQKQREISIRRLLGAKSAQIVVFVLKKYISVVMITGILSVLCCSIFYRQYRRFLFAGSICMISIVVLWCTAMIFLLLRTEIVEEIQ